MIEPTCSEVNRSGGTDETIYVLTNEAMPGLVKIGFTRGESIQTRLTNLSSFCGVPLAFECYFAARVEDAVKLEKILHQLFADARINPRREFFKVDPEKVVLAITIGRYTEITPGEAAVEPEAKIALERVKDRRPRIKLDAIGIDPGDELTFSRDEEVTARVVAGNKVDFEGEALSLTDAARRVLQRMDNKAENISGSRYWMFEGELLDERRRRMEAETFEEGGKAG